MKEAIDYFKRVAINSVSIFERGCAEKALKALYKQDAIKPIRHEKYNFICPFCKEDLGVEIEDISIYDMTPPEYCEKCGQHIDWTYYTTEKGGAE